MYYSCLAYPSVFHQILSWEFCTRRHEELLPRRLVAPQVTFVVLAIFETLFGMLGPKILECHVSLVYAGEPIASGCREMSKHNRSKWFRWNSSAGFASQ